MEQLQWVPVSISYPDSAPQRLLLNRIALDLARDPEFNWADLDACENSRERQHKQQIITGSKHVANSKVLIMVV